ncbi:MAG: histidine phosphatase family protein [Alcanivorax sp.]|nr:MAG: histidine phosphatase family protein [Ketobacter sp. GenoA1]RLT97857.1 MAG: histidine phosphatase family protein [Ketobacter sp.]TNC86797.1 MAG: histidine phosphatase family protein [Alcanivorax sp.]
MMQLHPALIPSLEQLPSHVPVALVTRHSIREQPANRFAGYDVPLTPEGIELAREWGRCLNRPIVALHSSPVGRCVKTAEAMAEGAGIELPVATHPALVEPGSYVVDLPVAGPYFVKLGPLAFARKHLKNEVRGVLSPQQGAKQLLQHIETSLRQPGTFTVHVTHDTILASFIYFLRRESDIDEAHWPWMLEGAFLWFDEGQVHWLWRGEAGSLHLDQMVD